MLNFFFQAEDGIRDDLVTGVQTCALPISHEPKHHAAEIVSGEGGEQEHDDCREKGRADDTGEEQSAAIDLSFAAAEEIYGHDGCGGTTEPAQRRAERGGQDSQPTMASIRA